MMQYFKIAPGKFIQYDDTTGRLTVLVRSELLTEKQELLERIRLGDSQQPTSAAAWIAWAKANYPYVDHSAEQIRVDEIEVLLGALKEL